MQSAFSNPPLHTPLCTPDHKRIQFILFHHYGVLIAMWAICKEYNRLVVIVVAVALFMNGYVRSGSKADHMFALLSLTTKFVLPQSYQELLVELIVSITFVIMLYHL